MIAWAVTFGQGLIAFFTDHGRAERYAQNSHGEITELHSEDEDDEERGSISGPDPVRRGDGQGA